MLRGGKKMLILFYFVNFSSKKPFPQAFYLKNKLKKGRLRQA